MSMMAHSVHTLMQ